MQPVAQYLLSDYVNNRKELGLSFLYMSMTQCVIITTPKIEKIGVFSPDGNQGKMLSMSMYPISPETP